MVADGGKDESVGEVFPDDLHTLLDGAEVEFSGGVVQRVGHQVSRPQDEVYVLRMD